MYFCITYHKDYYAVCDLEQCICPAGFFVINEIINDYKQFFRVLYFHSIVIRAVLIPISNILEHGSLEMLRNLFMMTQIANLSWISEGALCSGT